MPDTDEEQPREFPSVRFRWFDLVIIGVGFGAEVSSAVENVFGNLLFSFGAHRNWQIDRDSEKLTEHGVIITDE